MLKIRDYRIIDGKKVPVDLKELENFGFKYIVDILDKTPYYFKRAYLANDNDDKICYHVEVNTRKIIISRLDGDLDSTLYDLMKADLMEWKDNEI